MKVRVTPRTSLFVRMSLLFGLLVTVPLLISGIVHTLAGWQSVHRSGNEVKEVGRDALDTASARIKTVTSEQLKRAAGDLSRLGERQVDEASKRAEQVGKSTLSQSNREMKRAANDAIQSANKQMVGVGKAQMAKALHGLSDQHTESLQLLNNRFINGLDRQLNNNVEPIRELERNLVASWEVSAERRALAVGDWTESQVSQLARMMTIALNAGGVANYRPPLPDEDVADKQAQERADNAVRFLLGRLSTPRYTDLNVVRLVLISELGEEYYRWPQTDLPVGRAVPDWENHPTRTGVLKSTQPYVIESVRPDDITPERWILRIAVKATPNTVSDPPAGAAEPAAKPQEMAGKAGDPEPAMPGATQRTSPATPPRILVADIAVDNIVERAVVSQGNTPVTVFSAGLGIAVSRPAADKTPVAPELLKALTTAQPKDYANKKYSFSYTADNKKLLGIARYWQPADVWLVATQADDQVRQNAVALQKSLLDAGKSSLNEVRADSTKFISEQLKKAADKQSNLTADAQRKMQVVADAEKSLASAELSRAEEKQVATVPLTLRNRMQLLRKEIKGQIQKQSEAIATDADEELRKATDTQKNMAAQKIEQQSAAVANSTARQMMLTSTLLLVLFPIAAIFLATWTARSLVRPINRLAVGTQALAEGDYSQRIKVRGEDELARLAVAFNEMAGAIQRGQSELQSSHDVLAAEKLRIQAIAESSPDGLVMFEPGEMVAFINPTAIRLLDLQEELPAAPFEISQLPEAAALRLQEARQQANAGEGVQEYEFAEPQRRILQVREVQLRSPGGKSHGCLLHLHDITRDRLIDEMKSDFISLVSHELRTPLVSILGFSSYMLTGKMGTVADQQKTALESIHRQAKRLSAIISDFLDISRIESGKVELAKRPVQVIQIAEKVVQDLRPQASEKAIRVEAHVEPSPYPVVALGDESRIAQVFTNLVGNALKFTEREGVVDVSLSRMNGEVVCKVRDSGCGIPPDELDRVFDRFYQVEKVVTRKTGGTGLGLAIVKNIVEAHGGRVWIESQVGEGTTVSFSLPGTDPV